MVKQLLGKLRFSRKCILITVLLTSIVLVLFFISVPIASRRYSLKGIDISHHQGTIDWHSVSEQGISFAYIKATEGSSLVDEKLAENYEGVSKTDIKYSFYHFLSLDSPAETQMANFQNAVKNYELKMIPAIDVEWYGDMRQNPPDKDIVLLQVRELSALMEKEYGTKPVIYTTQSFYFKYLNGEIKENPLWIRNTYFAPIQNHVIWQYSEKFDLGNAIETGKYVDADVIAPENLDKILYNPTLYEYSEIPLERNGVKLHLDCLSVSGKEQQKDILLIHGVTYSSNEFDTDYEDYSLVRRLARKGYNVWRLDIAGFGQSEEVEDGYMPDSDYAAEDIGAAVNEIVKNTGNENIDILGWSWGTVTVSRFAAMHPEHIRKIVLYAPILTGVGDYEVTDAFHHNTWEHAADDFQRCEDGTLDYSVTEKNVIDIFCSNCWHYDGEYSPNGGRRDICVAEDVELIDLTKLKNPTLIICGSNDPYLNYNKISEAKDMLPEGSSLEMIDGGSHVIMIEKPYYHDFQDRLIRFLGE